MSPLVVAAVEAAVAHARRGEQPWPHYRMDDVFPEEYYQLIRANLPAHRDMEPLSRKTTNRLLYWLKHKNDPIISSLAPFWQDFCLLFEPLRAALETRVGKPGVKIGAEVVYDMVGYSLGPHTDKYDKLITCLFYLPDPKDFRVADCTLLFHGREPDPRGKGHPFSSDYKPIIQVPFQPNCGLFFERTDISFHGVLPTRAPRWSLAFDVFKE